MEGYLLWVEWISGGRLLPMKRHSPALLPPSLPSPLTRRQWARHLPFPHPSTPFPPQPGISPPLLTLPSIPHPIPLLTLLLLFPNSSDLVRNLCPSPFPQLPSPFPLLFRWWWWWWWWISGIIIIIIFYLLLLYFPHTTFLLHIYFIIYFIIIYFFFFLLHYMKIIIYILYNIIIIYLLYYINYIIIL